MIAPAKKCTHEKPAPAWHAGFLKLLPRITRYARVAFAKLPAERREDLVEEAVANAMVAYVRLFERGKTEVAFASVLARFAIAQIRDGRRVGNRLNILDVSARYAQARKQIVLERLDHYDRNEAAWIEAVVEDHHTPIADQVAFRLDFPRWLRTFNQRDRRIAEQLAAGHNTGDVARRFHLSPGRVSQKRREYALSWQRFHGESPRQEAASKAA
jgi:hypothetical protein